MSRVGAFLGAARPRTLPAAGAPVLVGSAAAFGDGAFALVPAVAALLGALLIQVGTNYTNDLFDHLHGADGPDRVGERRAVASGDVSVRAMAIAAALAFGAAAGVGLYLVALAGWPILIVGVVSIASGIAYTGGPWPLAYHGLGDVFVFLFFGLVAVSGSYFVQVEALTGSVVAVGAAIGCLATAILVVNNVRDVASDARAGKRTLVVRIGRPASRALYLALLVAAFGVVVGLARAPVALLPLASAPLAVSPALAMIRRSDGPALDRALGATGRLLAAFALTWAPGLALGAVG